MRQTSIEAYAAIKENHLLSKLRFQVYEVIYSKGPITARQVIEYLNRGNETGDRGRYNSRFAELVRQKVIKEVYEAPCPLSGVKVIWYDVTDKLPENISKNLFTKKNAETFIKEQGLWDKYEQFTKELTDAFKNKKT